MAKRMRRSSDLADRLVIALYELELEEEKIVEEARDLAKRTIKVGAEVAKREEMLLKLLRSSQDPEMAKRIVLQFKRGKLDTGRMSSRLVDILEDLSGQSLHPVSWSTRDLEWPENF